MIYLFLLFIILESTDSTDEESSSSDDSYYDAGMQRKYKNHFTEDVGKHELGCYSLLGRPNRMHIAFGQKGPGRYRTTVDAKYLNRWISVLKILKLRLVRDSVLPPQM